MYRTYALPARVHGQFRISPNKDAVPGESRARAFPSTGRPALRVRDDFLSPAERSLYGVLCTAVGDWATVCPKISLGDVFYAQSGDHNVNLRLRSRIAQKHVDFLLCDPGSMRPLLGVELDDASHERPDRQVRDALVDQVFAAAGLPLLRVPVQAAYDTRALAAAIRERVEPAGQGATAQQAVAEDVRAAEADADDAGPPSCPRCGQPMILRVAQRGTHQGEPFWGCPDYPRCRGVRVYRQAGEG
jgi:very-short-patch-repair endonuclease